MKSLLPNPGSWIWSLFLVLPWLPASSAAQAQDTDDLDVQSYFNYTTEFYGVPITGTVPGTTEYDPQVVDGTVVTLTAPATATGPDGKTCYFAFWFVNASGNANYGYVSNRTVQFTLVTESAIGAYYMSAPQKAQPTFSLTVESTPPTGLGIASSTADGGTTKYTKTGIPAGSSVNLQAPATDPTGYIFSQWMAGGAAQTPGQKSITFTMNKTMTAVAEYALTTNIEVLINGKGTVSPYYNGKALQIGRGYTMTASPGSGWLFEDWTGTVLTNTPTLHFIMQSNMLLQANFVTNVFLTYEGTYRGLFAPEGPAREQNNSGSFLFTVTSRGAISGNLDLGGQIVPLSGKFDLGGEAVIVSKPIHGIPSLTTTLELVSSPPTVGGTVSNSLFTAQLNGFRDVFSSSDKATEYEGQYTLIIPGTNDTAVGPFGTSYATVTVSSSGNITMAGSLADGTAISQSSVVSQDGKWPLYVSLYGGKGSLWGWNAFILITNQSITNVSALSWINETNSSKTAVYRPGFTNQRATLTGCLYLPSQALRSGLTVTLQETNPPFTIIVTNFSDDTNKLTLKTNKTTGVISGSFANPDESKQRIKVNGVILQGRTSAQGYFLGTNQSGTFLLDSP